MVLNSGYCCLVTDPLQLFYEFVMTYRIARCRRCRSRCIGGRGSRASPSSWASRLSRVVATLPVEMLLYSSFFVEYNSRSCAGCSTASARRNVRASSISCVEDMGSVTYINRSTVILITVSDCNQSTKACEHSKNDLLRRW